METEFATSSDGTRIAFAREGAGPPLIFVHGASGDRTAAPELQALLRQTHTVIAYDRRGRGDSGDHPDYNFLKEADDLRAVIKAVGGAPVVFGISMGARIALELLRDPPDLTAMVLFEAPATDTPDPAFSERLDQIRREMTRNGNEAAVIRHSRLFHQRSDTDIAALRDDEGRWALRVSSFPVTLREMEAVHRDCLLDAASLQAPRFAVHLLTGDATLLFLQQSAAMISALPFVRTSLISGGTHSYPTNRPDAVCRAASEALHS